MKKTITITVLILIFIIGCSNHSKPSNSRKDYPVCVYVDQSHCLVQLIKVRGHEYLVSYTESSYGGTCIIHAAHCHCQTTN